MDSSPEYAELTDAGQERMKRISERQRVIYIMREPIERALPAVRYVFRQNGQDIKAASVGELLGVAR